MKWRVCLVSAAVFAGCSFLAGSFSDFGATPGGVKDMRLARELIAQGTIPPEYAFVVEGMFSEHELGLSGPSCEQTLCINGALGVAPTLNGELSSWVQLGMSTNISPETFVRPSLTLVFTVDVSGSMGWEQGSTTPGELSRNLMRQLVLQLNADDRVAIVTYGTETKLVQEFIPGDQHSQLLSVINGLHEDGSTNMEAGLELAYSLAQSQSGTSQSRLLLFTDVQPNVGATTPSEFEQMVSAGAAQDVGLTVLGVGLGMNPELFSAMSTFKGGNAFGLITEEDVSRLVTDEWPFMVTPIAHNLQLNLSAPAGFALAESYGFPGSDGQPGSALNVASVFLSKRNGALLLRLSPQQDVPMSLFDTTSNLSYEDLNGQVFSASLDIQYNNQALDARDMFYEQPVVAKTVALAVLVSSMRDAASIYRDTPRQSEELMEQAVARITADAELIQDLTLAPEVRLAEDLLLLIQQRAPQSF